MLPPCRFDVRFGLSAGWVGGVALPEEPGPGVIAAARGQAMALLAEQIAREGLR